MILQIIWNLENKSRHALTNKICELHNNLFINYLFLFPIVIFILLVKVLWLFTTKKLANTNKNINKICLLVYCNDIYRSNFSITKSVGIYWRNHSGNKSNKKNQTIWLCVSSYKQYYRQHWIDDTICPWISQWKTFIGMYWWHYGQYYSGIKKKSYGDVTFIPTELLT
jgi:hypothetical protein